MTREENRAVAHWLAVEAEQFLTDVLHHRNDPTPSSAVTLSRTAFILKQVADSLVRGDLPGAQEAQQQLPGVRA